jgi:hypothetical protein
MIQILHHLQFIYFIILRTALYKGLIKLLSCIFKTVRQFHLICNLIFGMKLDVLCGKKGTSLYKHTVMLEFMFSQC